MKKVKRSTKAQMQKSTNCFCTYVLVACALICAGCETLRFAPSETQKQNAWLHNRTAIITAETARSGNTSEELRALTKLSELQSRPFTAYFGLPKEFPQAETAEDILAQSNWQLARMALTESAERPDAWQLADSAFELAIGVCALLGGVYGTKAVKFLKEAQTKSKALREIIEGNELFKSSSPEYSSAFKEAQKNQSPQTCQIVAETKANSNS